MIHELQTAVPVSALDHQLDPEVREKLGDSLAYLVAQLADSPSHGGDGSGLPSTEEVDRVAGLPEAQLLKAKHNL